MTIRVGRDSTVPADIPLTGLSVAMLYANGRYAASLSDIQRFHVAGIHVAMIDVNGSDPGADILDDEPGDATDSMAVDWTRRKLALKGLYPPIIYRDRAGLTPLFNNMAAARFAIGKHYRIGIATLDGTRTVADMTGVTFVQALGESLTHGHYDESVIYDDNWFPSARPVPRLVSVKGSAIYSDDSVKSFVF